MQLHSFQSNYMHSAHIAKLDHTLRVPDYTTCFQAFGCFPHTFAANAPSHHFRLGDFHIFLPLSRQNLFGCRTSLAAEPLSHWIRLVYRRDAAGFLKWTFAVMQLVFCTLW